MRKSQAERIREYRRKQGDPIRIGEDGEDPSIGLAKLMAGSALLPTQRAYFLDSSRYKAYKGPAGCGKTVINSISVLSRALWIPGSVGLVAQYEYNDLLNSTAKTMERILDRLPVGTRLDREKNPPMKWIINPIGGGEPSTIIFMGLKDNLGGFEFNYAFLDEVDKIPEQAVRLVDGRLRNPGGGYAMMMAFNPPDKGHWLYTACTGRDRNERKVLEPWIRLYEPQPNENEKNLPPGYYDNLRSSYTEDMIARLVDGDWGSTFEGAPVYREFNYNTHTRKDLMRYFDPDRPVLRFWDFGYNSPYCCWAQLDWCGRLLVFHEVAGKRIEASEFARRCKAETALKFSACREFLDFGDPAVTQRKDTGQTLAVFAKEGITMRYRRMNIDPGIRLIRQRFNLNIDGAPSIQLDRDNCPVLIGALRGGYHLDEKGEKPVKDGEFDHSADAFRYGCVNVLTNNSVGNGSVGFGNAAYEIPDSLEYDPRQDN